MGKQVDAATRERDVHVKLRDPLWFIKMLAHGMIKGSFISLWWVALEVLVLHCAYCRLSTHTGVYPTDTDSELLKHGSIEPKRAKFYMAEIVRPLSNPSHSPNTSPSHSQKPDNRPNPPTQTRYHP